jgi:hypothetical protein
MKHIAHEYTLVKPDGTIIEMREYHIDSHPVFETYVLEENQKFGGNLSVRKLAHECPVLIIGQDKSIYRQFIFSKKGWVGANGQQQLRPKDDGHGLMVSAFVSSAWSFFDILSDDGFLPIDVLEKVNARHRNKHYKSTDAALDINGTTAKPEIMDHSPFLHFFEYGMDTGIISTWHCNWKTSSTAWLCCIQTLTTRSCLIIAAGMERVRKMD